MSGLSSARMGRRAALHWLAGAVVGAGGQSAFSASDAAVVVTPPARLEVLRLANGARLVVLTEPDAPITVLEAVFSVTRAEEGNHPGINALLARAWLGGSENRSEALLRADAARVGALGTLSGDDWVELWGVSAKDRVAIERSAQNLLMNLVAQPSFDSVAVERAREAQLRELALRHEDLLGDVLDRLRARAWGTLAQGSPVMGTEEVLLSLKYDEVGKHYNRWFRPERVVFVVAGPLLPQAARRVVEAALGAGGWGERNSALPPPRKAPLAAPIPAGMRDHLVPRRAPATVWGAAYLAPGTETAGAEGWATLLVLDALVCGGKANRLFPLRDRGLLGYDVRSVLQPGKTQSLWSVLVIGDLPAETVRGAVLPALYALGPGESPITEKELARAKAYLKARRVTERQHLKERAFGVGWAEAMGLGAAFETGFDARIDAVTTEQVSRVARAVFSGNPAVVHSLPPLL